MPSNKDKTAERFAALFAGSESYHGTHGEPTLDPLGGVKWEIRETAKTLRGPATVEKWRAHLDGHRPLGAAAIRDDSTCVWGSIDIDDYDVEAPALIDRIEKMKLPLVPCRSKSGGLHLFLFSREPIEAGLMQSTLRDIAASLGYANCEIFPKQTKILVDKGEKPSWIVMPYCGTTFGGKLKEQVGLKRTGAEMTAGEFLALAERSRVRVEDIQVARSGGNSKGKKRERPPFSDGPPCIQHLTTALVKQGGQNNFLFHMGVYLKRKHPEDWQKRLEDANQKYCDPPYPSDKLAITVKSLDKKDYQYKCKDQPMAAHCDAMQCRTRKFGVGAGGTYPQITGISKLNSEPPVWFVDVEGAKIAMSTEDLQNYQRFHRLCIENTHKSFAIISQNVWYGVLNEALQNLMLLETPEELRPGAQFRELLTEFLTNRQRGRDKEDLKSGRPWENDEDGRHYFMLRPLQKFLEREGMRDFAFHKGRVTDAIRKLGGAQYTMNFGSTTKSCWFVPAEAVGQAEELETPRTEGEDL